MGSKWILVVQRATSDVTSETTVEEFTDETEARNAYIQTTGALHVYLAVVRAEAS